MGSRCAHVKGQFWGRRWLAPDISTCPYMSGGWYTQSDSAGDNTGTVRVSTVLHEVCIGATWWIRLNRPCATAIRPYVKLLWPLINIINKNTLVLEYRLVSGYKGIADATKLTKRQKLVRFYAAWLNYLGEKDPEEIYFKKYLHFVKIVSSSILQIQDTFKSILKIQR